MFTGIVQALGSVAEVICSDGDKRLLIETGGLQMESMSPGDSIAVNGVCLTAVAIEAGRFAADISRETLQLTTLDALTAGQPVNLEPALTLATPLGGHLVSGHVDGVAQLQELSSDARSRRLRFALPDELGRYVAAKGSICIDGTSLTVNSVSSDSFAVNIVPHTLEHTIIGRYQPGTRVNIEVDLVARYLERLLPEPG